MDKSLDSMHRINHFPFTDNDEYNEFDFQIFVKANRAMFEYLCAVFVDLKAFGYVASSVAKDDKIRVIKLCRSSQILNDYTEISFQSISDDVGTVSIVLTKMSMKKNREK